MIVDLVQATAGLKLVSTVTAGLFAGGSLYVSLIECPARNTHDATTAIKMWKPSFNRAKFYQSKEVIISSFSAFGAYACMKEDKDAMKWLGAGCAMLTMWPITMIIINPTNNQLLETEKCISKGDDWIRENLNQWWKVHSIRTVISTGAFCFMVYTLFKS